MTAFPTQKLELIATTRRARAKSIQDAMRAAGENVYCLDTIITTTLAGVEREAAEFRPYLGEPLPQHLHQALDLELGLWRSLQESLALYRDSEPTEADAAAYLTNVREFLAYQHDLVLLQAEMLQSCLVHHYRSAVAALAAAARQVPL